MKTIHKSAWIHIVDRKMMFLRTDGNDIFYLPGGLRNEGESDEAALVREIKEETTADLKLDTIELVKHLSVEAHGREDTMVEVRGYFSDYTGEIITASEIAEIGWFDSTGKDKVPSAAHIILDWLKEKDFID